MMMDTQGIGNEYIADIARYALGIAPGTGDARWFCERARERWSEIDMSMQPISYTEALRRVTELVSLFEMKQSVTKLKAGEIIKVGNNQIYFDKFDPDYPFVVEQFEFYDDYKGTGKPMYSVLDGFKTFLDAYEAAQSPANYRRRIACKGTEESE